MSGCRRKAIIVASAGVVLLALSFWRAFLSGQDDYWAGLAAGAGAGALVSAVLIWWSPFGLKDTAPRALARRYYRDFIPPMAAYVGVMLGWKPLLDMVEESWLRVVVALLPAVLVVLVIRAMARYVRDADEMQRRIELESVAIAAGVVAAGYMTAGFLQSAQLIQVPATVAMLWVFPMLCLLYGFIKVIIARRYL